MQLSSIIISISTSNTMTKTMTINIFMIFTSIITMHMVTITWYHSNFENIWPYYILRWTNLPAIFGQFSSSSSLRQRSHQKNIQLFFVDNFMKLFKWSQEKILTFFQFPWNFSLTQLSTITRWSLWRGTVKRCGRAPTRACSLITGRRCAPDYQSQHENGSWQKNQPSFSSTSSKGPKNAPFSTKKDSLFSIVFIA